MTLRSSHDSEVAAWFSQRFPSKVSAADSIRGLMLAEMDMVTKSRPTKASVSSSNIVLTPSSPSSECGDSVDELLSRDDDDDVVHLWGMKWPAKQRRFLGVLLLAAVGLIRIAMIAIYGVWLWQMHSEVDHELKAFRNVSLL